MQTAPLETTAIDSIAVLSERLTPINQAPALQQTQEPINLLTPVQFDDNYMPPKPKRMGTYDQEQDRQVRVIDNDLDVKANMTISKSFKANPKNPARFGK